MYKSKLIIGPEIFDIVSEETWNHLAQNGMTNTPFQTYAYQKGWWTHLGLGQLISVVVYQEPSQIIGLGCFYLHNGRIYFNASKEETDYLDVLVYEENAELVWSEIFTNLCSDACPSWHSLDFYNLPAPSLSRSILPRLSKNRGFIFSEERAEVCPVIPLGDSFDQYLAGIDKKQRHEIRRKMRKAANAGVDIEIVASAEQLPEAVDTFLDLLQKSTDEKNQWLNEGRTAVFQAVAQAALQHGTLLLMFTVLEGERLSALFNFIYDGRIWVYNSGIDISKAGNLSLGVVLTAHAIQHGIENGCHTFDFLRGDETYKYRFGAQDTEIFRIQIDRSPQ